ncbi:MAG: archaeosortase/exosortase family protein [Planctomycetota bacterium]
MIERIDPLRLVEVLNTTLNILKRNGWQRADLIRIVLSVAAAVLMTYPAWVYIFGFAVVHYEHARPIVLVPLVVIWLIWVRRARARNIVPGQVWPGWLLLAAGAQLYYFSFFENERLVTTWCLGAVFIVFGALIVTTGKSVLFQFKPAWFALFLLVPFPVTAMNLLSTPIQLGEAQVITAAYRAVGVDAHVIVDPRYPMVCIGSATLPVDSACKGVATALALLIICYGFVFGAPLRTPIRVGLLVLSPVIAVLCSSLSLFCTLWVYDQMALVTADTVRAVSEWLTLLFAFLLVAGLLRFLMLVSIPVYEFHLATDH